MTSQLVQYIEQVRRRWWVVLLVVAFAVFVTVMRSSDASPTYVGKSILVQSSPGRSPEQDATMAVGYAILFNEPVTIGRLRETIKVPDTVTFEARTVAASPILTIEATADDPKVAQDAAQRMAAAFREDINSVRRAGYAKEIKGTERQLQSVQSQREPDGGMNPLVPVVQARLDEMRSNATDQLQDLSLQAGVSKTDPRFALQLGTAAMGALFLGILAALGLAAVSQRVMNARDLVDKTGIEPLIEMPRGGSVHANRLREDRLRMLAHVVSRQDLPKSAVLALTDCYGAQGALDLAEDLARLSAQQGRRTVLVHAENSASQLTNHHVGFNNVLSDSGLVDGALIDGAVESLKILPAGSVVADRYPLLSRERIDAVLDELRMGTDTIVIAAPPITETIDSYPICGAADYTILVVDRRSSRSDDVRSAAEALTDAQAVLLGAVLIDGPARKHGDFPEAMSGRTGEAADQQIALWRQP
jgi:Mrp family chromosome partitioning ATPase/capsular polysaccharide biosynthesis protein